MFSVVRPLFYVEGDMTPFYIQDGKTILFLNIRSSKTTFFYIQGGKTAFFYVQSGKTIFFYIQGGNTIFFYIQGGKTIFFYIQYDSKRELVLSQGFIYMER